MDTESRPLSSRTLGGIVILLLAISCSDAPRSDEAPAPAAEEPAAERTASSGTPEGLEACSLFSKEEAEAALGRPLQEPESRPFNPVTRSSECQFESVEPGRTLLLRVEEPSNPEASLRRTRELLGDADEVPGLADHALYGASQLFVFAGRHQVTVTVGMPGTPVPKRRETAESIARTVLSRL